MPTPRLFGIPTIAENLDAVAADYGITVHTSRAVPRWRLTPRSRAVVAAAVAWDLRSSRFRWCRFHGTPEVGQRLWDAYGWSYSDRQPYVTALVSHHDGMRARLCISRPSAPVISDTPVTLYWPPSGKFRCGSSVGTNG